MRMLGSIAAALASVAMTGCASSPALSPGARSAAENAIGVSLDDFHAAAARADEPRYFAHFSPDAVFLGTDAKERWTRDEFRTYAHPFFNRGKAWNFHATTRHVTLSPRGDLAWFDEALATAKLGPARGSGVLERDANGHWLITQYNLAITIPNERFGEVHALLETPSGASGAPSAK